MPSPITNQPLHVAVVRRVKPGCELAFERALHDFVQRSLALPGQTGVHVIRPAPGTHSREYGIVRGFASREALALFRTSPEYLEWTHFARDLTDGTGRTEEFCGLESWFTMPGETLSPLPKWKMALLTYIGVYFVTTLLTLTVGPAIKGWPFLISNAVFNVIVVGSLTWLVMPLLTRPLHRWLYQTKGKNELTSRTGPYTL